MKFVKVQGNEKVYSMFGGSYLHKESVTLLVAVKDDKKLQEGKTIGMYDIICGYVLSGVLKRSNHGELLTSVFSLEIKELSEPTPEEIKVFNDCLNEHNLTIKRDKWYSYGDWHEDERLFYLNKDNMRLIINGELVLFSDLNKFENGVNIVLSGDNGYSHCWSETADANALFKFLNDNLFNVDKWNGLALRDDLWGWKTNNNSELIIKTTTKSFHESQVSFS